jgi:lipopolysaccharide export LptBFGC system permease protein LptF
MLWTLQWYIFREMAKTFLLTAIGLTGLIGLGGGVMNMIEAEQVTAQQLLRIMSLVLPVAGALTLPVASLFSATVTYGRFSADNELVACRASGINILYLLLPTMVFSVLSAVITFYCINYVIPGLISNLASYVQADAQRIVMSRLRSPSRLSLGSDRYLIYADTVDAYEGTSEDGQPAPDSLILQKVAFLEATKQGWSRYGTAHRADIRFYIGQQDPAIEADLYELTYFDRGHRQWLELEHDSIERFQIPQQIPLKPKWMNLGQLIWYRGQPAALPATSNDLKTLRAGIARANFYRTVSESWRDRRGKDVQFGDDKVRYTLTSGSLRVDERDNRPTFGDNVSVRERAVLERGRVREREVTAAEATLNVSPRSGLVSLSAYGNVRIVDTRAPDEPVYKDRANLDSFPLPEDAIEAAKAYPSTYLLDPTATLDELGTWAVERRDRLVHDTAETLRRITALIHARLAFSASVLVLVILGAGLSIIVRGAHALTAFGISFIPSLFVIVMIIMGRQMAGNEGTHLMGIMVIWGGIAVIGGLNLLTLGKFVRR